MTDTWCLMYILPFDLPIIKDILIPDLQLIKLRAGQSSKAPEIVVGLSVSSACSEQGILFLELTS